MAKFCPNCGNPLSSETLKFCPECGATLVPKTATHVTSTTENSAEQKIYYQDASIFIGSKVWEFIGADAVNSSLTRKKTIPVSAISGVDFVYNKSIIWLVLGILLLLISIAGFCIGNADNFYGAVAVGYSIGFPCIAISVFCFVMYMRTKEKGKIQVITNNYLSGYSYKGLTHEEAEKYLEPMRKCLLEKQGLNI